MTWHADSELVAGYVDDRLSPAQARRSSRISWAAPSADN